MNCTVVGGRLGRRSLQSPKTNRGICANSGSPIWTAISCVCSTTLPGNCRSSKHSQIRDVFQEMAFRSKQRTFPDPTNPVSGKTDLANGSRYKECLVYSLRTVKL